MAPSNLGYSLREAGSHFFRNWTSSLGAVFTIFLSLFIIGLFIIGSAMITSVIGDIEQTVTITAFVSDEASDEDIQAFRDELETWDNVAHIDFKTKEDALEDYRATMSDHAEATISALDGENPLPRSFVIQMEDSSQVADTAERIKNDELFRKIVDDNVSAIIAGISASQLMRWHNDALYGQALCSKRLATMVSVPPRTDEDALLSTVDTKEQRELHEAMEHYRNECNVLEDESNRLISYLQPDLIRS